MHPKSNNLIFILAPQYPTPPASPLVRPVCHKLCKHADNSYISYIQTQKLFLVCQQIN